jgi:hypothetical protein
LYAIWWWGSVGLALYFFDRHRQKPLNAGKQPVEPARVNCLSFKSHRSGTLRGFASIHLPRMRLRIHNVVLHEKDGRRWAQLPTQAMVRDGELARNPEGKVKYGEPVLEFDDPAIGCVLSDAIVQAVLAYAPEAFDGEG